MPSAAKFVQTGTLSIAYEEAGEGTPGVLLHGFPYDPRAYDDVAVALAAAGCRAIVPYLRGYGPTRFLSDTTMRSGQQAALGSDLLGLLDALEIPEAIVAGYDWGGRAACVVSALLPERVRGLVTMNDGYNIHDIAGFARPAPPEDEYRWWYQYYFHTERGRAGLTANRDALCRLLWRLWSPNWRFDDATFEQTAVSFQNPDFVEIVIHSYRHRYAYAAGDPALDSIEEALARQPHITVPTILLHGDGDGVSPAGSSVHDGRHFSGPFERRVIPGAGHTLPQEAPGVVAAAILELAER